MKGQKYIAISVIFIITAILGLSIIPAFTGYGVAEKDGQIEINFDKVNPGSSAQKILKLELNNQEELIYAKINVEGSQKDWVVIPKETYIFLPNEETSIPIYLNVPENTEEGEYNAEIIVMSLGDTEQESVLKDQIIYYVPINIQVNSDVVEGIGISSLTAYNTEKGQETYFKATINNLGNYEIQKRVDIEIFDSNNKLVKQDSIDTSLIAYEQKELVYGIKNNLDLGDYYLRVKIDDKEQTAKFSVKESLVTNGEIVYNDIEIAQDYTVKVITYFKNTGEKVITPSIEGMVQQENIAVKEFKTDSQIVLPGEYGLFEYTYYEDVKGEYTLSLNGISGSVVLDDKEEDFFSKGFLSLNSNVYILLSVILFLLITLHYVFHRKKE